MKPVLAKMVIGESGESAATFPFRAGDGTLQLTTIGITCSAKPKKEDRKSSSDTEKRGYVPFRHRNGKSKLVVQVEAHVMGPNDASERTLCIAQGALVSSPAPAAAGSTQTNAVRAGSTSTAAELSSFQSVKLDLRFQMEKVRLTARVKRIGPLWEDYDTQCTISAAGVVSAIV